MFYILTNGFVELIYQFLRELNIAYWLHWFCRYRKKPFSFTFLGIVAVLWNDLKNKTDRDQISPLLSVNKCFGDCDFQFIVPKIGQTYPVTSSVEGSRGPP